MQPLDLKINLPNVDYKIFEIILMGLTLLPHTKYVAFFSTVLSSFNKKNIQSAKCIHAMLFDKRKKICIFLN